MRCNYCGYDNSDPSMKNCVKCGHPLEASAPGNSYTPKTGIYSSDGKETRVLDGDMNNLVGGGVQLNKTVMQAAPSEQSLQLKKTVMQAVPGNQSQQLKQTVMQGVFDNQPAEAGMSASNDICPKCSYPLTDGYCARCGYDRNGEEKTEEEDVEDDVVEAHKSRGMNKCQHCNNDVPVSYQYCPYCGNVMDAGTVIMSPERISSEIADTRKPEPEVPHFRLTMIADEGETFSEDKAVREFEGECVMLNRANTDPGNRTITSKEQAVMVFKDGHWTILNHSQHNPTLVIANRDIELRSGDVIMLGDRRFRFELDA